ncbi:MAG: hypothetical protein F6J93_29940 [Oscillatoria sp. SIO1A7]|nr:hypothetical protein [Oscillatoria sp. SIO1A7]
MPDAGPSIGICPIFNSLAGGVLPLCLWQGSGAIAGSQVIPAGLASDLL